MQDQILLTVTIVTDDETGIWNIGELDFGILGACKQYIEKKPENRERLADWLQMLADSCRNSQPPFGSKITLEEHSALAQQFTEAALPDESDED